MTGRDRYLQWLGNPSPPDCSAWERLSPYGQLAWDRLAAAIERERADAIAAAIQRRAEANDVR